MSSSLRDQEEEENDEENNEDVVLQYLDELVAIQFDDMFTMMTCGMQAKTSVPFMQKHFNCSIKLSLHNKIMNGFLKPACQALQSSWTVA